MNCFSGDSFSFLGAGFANIPPTFLISCEVQTRYSKTLKYSEQYIRDHLSGTNTAWKIVLQKFVKRTVKVIFSLVFVCFRFKEISYFLNFPSNKNVRKQHLYANAYSCVNMKFLYAIAVRKDEISCHFVTKTIVFSPAYRSTFRWRYLCEKMKSPTSYCS